MTEEKGVIDFVVEEFKKRIEERYLWRKQNGRK